MEFFNVECTNLVARKWFLGKFEGKKKNVKQFYYGSPTGEWDLVVTPNGNFYEK